MSGLASAVYHPYRRTIVIGLVNNMPDGALRATEEQFRGLLEVATGRRVRLKRFYIPEIERSNLANLYLEENYAEIDELWSTDVDGLIVTGTEPKAPFLSAEPYWATFTQLVDWTDARGVSTVWSCLAAHAAVECMDGIGRRPLGKKLFGLFDCSRAQEHPLFDDCPGWCIPHSRYNEIPEQALTTAGYRILTRSHFTGADVFIRDRSNLQIFLQGHPEYDLGALGREYRRDVKRFLSGKQDSYPDIPIGYFSIEMTASLLTFKHKALGSRKIELLSEFPFGAEQVWSIAAWHESALTLYRNWLSHLAMPKAVQVRGRSEMAPTPAHALN
jgi:homoserine O-succinyltransferase